ncbi:MtrAB system histidine kinase MtrB [Rugosimonospora africana]|uniref:MtrAB system histidine kinase MtrB n=1 Tax=Rugosimonospora africana TaxID=556532 RepID=UPI003570D7EE
MRALRRTVGERVIVAWVSGRRAWRRSLQLRMVVITLLVSGVLVGAFGVLVASMITEGLVDAKVTSARDQVSQGAKTMGEQLDAIKDPLDVRTSIPGVLTRLTANTEGATVAILSDDGAPQPPQTSGNNALVVDAIPRQLQAYVGGGRTGGADVVAHQFVTADLGNGDEPYLVYGSPVTVSNDHFELYYFFPLNTEQQAADLVRTTVVATGVALVVLLAVLAALTTRLVVQPVRTAARTAQRLSAGLLDQRMEVRGEDDLALLAASFNQMAENLQRQIIRLEEMSRLQRRFTSDVSHELRTPLTTVRMAADLIYAERDEFDPAMARSAELLHAELDRFEELLTDLLEISRFDAGFAVLDAEPTDVAPIVESVSERLSSLAERCGVRIDLNVPAAPVIAEVDPRRVERILRNLVGNAVEHAEARPVVVTLHADEVAVAITVRDHGIGLNKGDEKLVFNRFWRADPSRARQTGGTGLGLSIALEDARLHGGWLEAWGAPGQGAQFRLTLPLRAGDRLTSSPLRLVPPDADSIRGRLALTAGPAAQHPSPAVVPSVVLPAPADPTPTDHSTTNHPAGGYLPSDFAINYLAGAYLVIDPAASAPAGDPGPRDAADGSADGVPATGPGRRAVPDAPGQTGRHEHDPGDRAGLARGSHRG